MNRASRNLTNSRLLLAAGLIAAGLLAACATVPPPAENLRAAQQAIANAERVEAGRYAAADLSSARTKLSSADAAVTEKRMTLAQQYADESRAEAELASARTAATKANAVNDDMKRSTGTLVEEMKRNSGDKQ
jgi:outer membrane PBP1 activator LpoA protein